MARSSRSRATLLAGALAVTAVVTGIATSAGPLTPSAAADGLEPFEGCEELLEWYVEAALPSVGPWGLSGGIVYDALRRDVPVADAAGDGAAPSEGSSSEGSSSDPGGASPDAAVTGSDTGTNVQERGVDEPDRAKTEGSTVVHVREQRLVVTDVTDGSARELGTLALPEDLVAPELLLSGDTVLVLGPAGSDRALPVEPMDAPATDDASSRVIAPGLPGWSTPDRTRLLEVSLADPTSPRVVSDLTFGGSLVTARHHVTGDAGGDASAGAGTVRLVLRTDEPTIDFVRPDRNRTEAEALRQNRQLLRDSTIDDWLPTVRVAEGPTEPLVACEDVHHPRGGATSIDGGMDYGTVAVVTLPASAPEQATTTAVTTGSDTVYASRDRLYLAVPDHDAKRTDVHAFALDGTTTSYVASGSVEGLVEDRWAMDEHEGVLRLAVAHLDETWTTRDNGVVTLVERGGELGTGGEVRGLGPDEEIKSVRWFDSLAVVVTFRQTDPLYTVDLSDPARPRSLGELKIPGFSEYLHPVGRNRLVGVGHDATLEGELRGGQLSLFDIGDLTAPARLSTLAVGGRDARPVAGWEPRTFTWLPGTAAGTGILLTAVTDDATGRAWLAEVAVREGVLEEGRRFPLPAWEAESGRALPLPGGRVAVVGSEVDVVEVAPL